MPVFIDLRAVKLTMYSESLPPRREHELLRDPGLGFEPAGVSVVRCLEHGYPWPLERWHYHDEYELQLIVETHGRAFVGDYIGHYTPNHLVLVGPRLPHNWMAADVGDLKVPVRNLVIQFLDEPFRKGMQLFPELADLVPLFDRAAYGIQFFGISDAVRRSFYSIKENKGLQRFSEFTNLLLQLAQCQNYQLLSSVRMQSSEDVAALERINSVLDFLNTHYAQELSMGDLCALVQMSESGFSRFFLRTTGNTFTDYLTHLRISKACQLLMTTDHYVNTVCQEVGFRNIAYFNRRFLELKGSTPTEFRRAALANK